MTLPTYYATGTASVNTGATTVTGTGTGWGSDSFGTPVIAAGDFFMDPAQPEIPPQRIASVTDATHLVLARPWPGSTVAGPYEVQFVGDIVRSTAQTRRYLERLGQLAALGIQPNAFGDFADRAAYDGEAKGYIFLSLDGDGVTGIWTVYIKQTATPGDWDAGQQLRGGTGPIGPSGILVNWRNAWVTGTAYAVKDGVQFGGSSYICPVAHVAGDFATDLAAGRWELTSAKGAPGNDGVLSANEEIVTAASRTITAADNGKIFIANRAGGVTFDFDPAAALGAHWLGMFKNIGTGPLTIDPNGAETIDGVSTLMLSTSESAMISANGALLRSHFRGSAGGKRELLTANLTLFVRTDGNDANDGRTNTVGGAFKSIQRAIDVTAALDLGVYNVTIQVGGGGPYTAGFAVTGPWVGSGNVTVVGDPATPSNVFIDPAAGNTITCQAGGRLQISGLKIRAPAGASALAAVDGGTIRVTGKMDFAGAGWANIFTNRNGVVAIINVDYDITGNAPAHYRPAGGFIQDQGGTVTLSGAPAFGSSYLYTDGFASIVTNNKTYVGAATGKRFTVNYGASVTTFGESKTKLPGNAAGEVISGCYDDLTASVGGSVGAVDNRLVRSDGTGGKTLQNTGITVDDSDQMSGLTGLTLNSAAQFKPQVTVTAEYSGAHGAYVNFQKGRAGGPVQSGDDLGTFIGQARDSTSAMVNAAYFTFQSVAAPAAGSVDSRVTFVTTSAATQSTKMMLQAGLIVGSPTGGDKGFGAINASDVYNDNVALTCMALASEFLANGTVNTEFWDNLVPPQVIPEFRTWQPYCEEQEVTERIIEETEGGYVSRVVTSTRKEQLIDLMPVWDEHGNGISAIEVPAMVEVVTPEQIIPRRHELAHRFKAMIEDGFDPRDPVAYITKLRADQALPGMPTKAEWQHGEVGSGELFGRLWLATEMLAIVVMNMHDRLTALEAG